MLTTIDIGNFLDICIESNLSVCGLWQPRVDRACVPDGQSLVGNPSGYIASLIIAVISAILIIAMMYKTHVKYAAVGRREMNILFAFFFFASILRAVVVSGFVSGSILEYLAAAHIGLTVAFFWVLLLNGLVGFQLVEDGGPLSFFGILLSGFVWIAVGILFSLDASGEILGANTSPEPYQSITLYGVYLIFPLVCVIGYVILQTILVVRNLGDQKPLINLYLGLAFFLGSVVFTVILNEMMCNLTRRAVDGGLFAAFCELAAILFVYRFWDSITEDDWDNIDDIFV